MSNLENISDADLLAEVERRNRMAIPKPLKKINWKMLIALAQEGVGSVAGTGNPGKDFEEYMFQQAMECIFGPDVWKWWNKYYNE